MQWISIQACVNTVEVKLLRYVDGSYKALAQPLAKPAPKVLADPESDTALQAGVVTLKANYEGLLLNPSVVY